MRLRSPAWLDPVKMRVAPPCRWAASMALTNSASTPRDLRVCNESEARVRSGDHMQQSGRLYNQAVQLCIRPKEEIQLCFLKGVDAFRLAAAAFRQVPIEV